MIDPPDGGEPPEPQEIVLEGAFREIEVERAEEVVVAVRFFVGDDPVEANRETSIRIVEGDELTLGAFAELAREHELGGVVVGVVEGEVVVALSIRVSEIPGGGEPEEIVVDGRFRHVVGEREGEELVAVRFVVGEFPVVATHETSIRIIEGEELSLGGFLELAREHELRGVVAGIVEGEVVLAGSIRVAGRPVGVERLLGWIARFSPLALGCAVALGLSGAFASWLHIDAIPSLWRTGYGRWLLAKLAAVGVAAAFGAWNWKRSRAPTKDSAGSRRLAQRCPPKVACHSLSLAATF